MLRQNIKLFIVLSLIASTCFSAISSEDEKLMEELAGKSPNKPAAMLQKKTTAPISERHLSAGLNAFKAKNYILALKHYNTVIIKYSKSKEYKSAFLAKAKLYTEMGLKEQAELNFKLAHQLGNKISK